METADLHERQGVMADEPVLVPWPKVPQLLNMSNDGAEKALRRAGAPVAKIDGRRHAFLVDVERLKTAREYMGFRQSSAPHA